MSLFVTGPRFAAGPQIMTFSLCFVVAFYFIGLVDILVGMAQSWAAKRKTNIAIIFFLGVFVIVGLPVFFYFYQPPTCSDGKMNGRERGIDCGGKCAKICAADFLNPIIIWSRMQKIATGVYNVGAYLENPNLEGGANGVAYVFRLYDAQGLPIAERFGTTYLPPHKNVLVFENALLTGERQPTRVTFEFTSRVNWEKKIQKQELLEATDKKLSEEGKPRLEAIVHNKNVEAYDDIGVAAILYDINENVVAFSKTKIDHLEPNQGEKVFFTWPLPFTASTTKIEVIPTIAP